MAHRVLIPRGPAGRTDGAEEALATCSARATTPLPGSPGGVPHLVLGEQTFWFALQSPLIHLMELKPTQASFYLKKKII